jgi:hypothetical protein
MRTNNALHSDYFNRFLGTFSIEWPDELSHELAELEKMSEKDACTVYNVDSKDEARQCIIEWYN